MFLEEHSWSAAEIVGAGLAIEAVVLVSAV
jgi:hypothetical protein